MYRIDEYNGDDDEYTGRNRKSSLVKYSFDRDDYNLDMKKGHNNDSMYYFIYFVKKCNQRVVGLTLEVLYVYL